MLGLLVFCAAFSACLGKTPSQSEESGTLESQATWAVEPPPKLQPEQTKERTHAGKILLKESPALGQISVETREPSPSLSSLSSSEESSRPKPLSLGLPFDGRLENAVPLQLSVGYQLLPNSFKRESYWTTQDMAELLERASQQVQKRYPGSRLWVGDLSKRMGGPYSPHASHQNGRDADLAFFVSDLQGRFIDPATMLVFNEALRHQDMYLDIQRTWALIEAFLSDPVEIQWIFVAKHIKASLLDYAKATKSPYLEKALRVLQQPGDSAPHDDHLHLRIYCPLLDFTRGCQDSPPFHPWIRRGEEKLKAWYEGIRPFLKPTHSKETEWALNEILKYRYQAAEADLQALLQKTEGSGLNDLQEKIKSTLYTLREQHSD